MNFNDEETRQDAIGVMKEIASYNHKSFKVKLDLILTAPERIIQEEVDMLGFKEGAWYRPEHNIIVPAAMIAICKKEGFNRDLVFAAQIHDAGNSKMKIAETTQGADWVSADKRFKHMEIGRAMFIDYMQHLNSQGLTRMSKDRIIELANLVGIHDAPYIHKEITEEAIKKLCTLYGVEELPLRAGRILTSDEAKVLRSADRVFVPSVLSWYKDMIAHMSDARYITQARKLGFNITPLNFLLCRLANFYPSQDNLPNDWEREKFPLMTKYAEYGGEGHEPCYTLTEQHLVNKMFKNRIQELPIVSKAPTIRHFADVFEISLVGETNFLIEYAAAA